MLHFRRTWSVVNPAFQWPGEGGPDGAAGATRSVRSFQLAQQALHRGIVGKDLGNLPRVGKRVPGMAGHAVHGNERAQNVQVVAMTGLGGPQHRQRFTPPAGGMQPHGVDVTVFRNKFETYALIVRSV